MASGNSTKCLTSDLNELCDSVKLFLEQKQTGISNIINKEIVAIVDELLEYKCISKKQHIQILTKDVLLHIKIK